MDRENLFLGVQSLFAGQGSPEQIAQQIETAARHLAAAVGGGPQELRGAGVLVTPGDEHSNHDSAPHVRHRRRGWRDPVARRPRRRRDGRAAAGFLILAILLVGFVFFYPIVAVILTSLQDPRSGAFVGMTNYGALFADEIFQDAVRNNLKLLVVLPVVVALALVLAQVLFDRIRGWRLYRALIFLPYIVPVVVAALVFGQILQQNGLVNEVLRFLHLDFLAHDWLGDPNTAIWSLAGVVVWRELAFGVVLFLARMTQLPLDLFDAARVDGANWWQRLRHVTVPQMSTIIAFYCGIVLIALLSWVFNYVLVLTRGGPGTSTYVIEYYVYSRAFQYGDFGNAAALSSIMLVVILAVMGTYLTCSASEVSCEHRSHAQQCGRRSREQARPRALLATPRGPRAALLHAVDVLQDRGRLRREPAVAAALADPGELPVPPRQPAVPDLDPQQLHPHRLLRRDRAHRGVTGGVCVRLHGLSRSPTAVHRLRGAARHPVGGR